MSGIAKFRKRAEETGSKGLGVALDAVCFGIGRATTRLKMNNYFLRKQYTGSRFGWMRYVSEPLAAKMLPLNPADEIERFTDKADFDARFQQFLGREWLCPDHADPDALGRFLQRHPDAIAKPRRGKGGFHVERLAPPVDDDALRKLCDRLTEEDKIVEERIPQHDEINEFYANAVNTIRITSIQTENGPVLLAPLMRIGCGGAVADNFDSGGVLMMLDGETGEMLTGAMNKQYVWFDNHPESGKRFQGFRVPHWQQALRLCREAAALAPRALYVGWDVAITPEGAVLVEGNTRPSFGWQCIDKRGWRKEFLAAYRSALRVRKEQRER